VAEPSLALVRADRDGRLRYGLALLGLVGWLLYTRVFWTLHTAHATLPPCPFLIVTGQPCPLCGGTRSFAQMWQGDLAGAARFHPLGPALFMLTLLALPVLALLAARGVVLRWRPSSIERRTAYLAVGAVFLSAWVFRLLFLPLPR
jgi:hypothetical protein